MNKVKEDVQIKQEIKEESVLPLIEPGDNLENTIIIVRKKDEEFTEAVANAAEESSNLLKLDYEATIPILTSLVGKCAEPEVKKYQCARAVKPLKGEGDRNVDSEEEIFENLTEQDVTNQIEGEAEDDNMEDDDVGCIVSYDPGESILEHINVTNSDSIEQCDKCEEFFECRDSLLKHVKSIHAKKKPPKHRCSICGMGFRYKANFRKHEKLHNDSFRFTCKYCNTSFKQSLTLKNHIVCVHKNDKSYECADCGSSFKSLNYLKSHIEVHHNAGVTYPCDFCHMEFKRECYLKRHTSLHSNPDKKFTCDDCGLKCRSKTDIAKHVLTHIGIVERRFLCEICGAGFSKHAHVVRHRRTHSVEKLFACHLCDKAYKDRYSLKTHNETAHLGITYSCEICGFKSDRHSLKKHMKRCDGQKQYTCEVCQKVYFLKKWFEQHTSKCTPVS